MFAVNVLYLLPSANIYGGTPQKTLDLVKGSRNRSIVYFWSDAYSDKHILFRQAGAGIYSGAYGRNVFRHVRFIVDLIDMYSIDLIQTQFSFGEVLGYFAKLMRPRVKLIVTFEGSLKPSLLRRLILKWIYHHVDNFIYISEYVKKEKLVSFPMLESLPGRVIYNGSNLLAQSVRCSAPSSPYKILDVAGLTPIKNISTLIRAVGIMVHDMDKRNVELIVAGEGPERGNLERLIFDLHLARNVHLIGYRDDIGDLLCQCAVFAHPSVAEGFGIAVTEAMMTGLPVVAADAGALPELIIDGESGLLVNPLDAEKWAEVISKLMKDPVLAKQIADNGRIRALNLFSTERFVSNYENMYEMVVNRQRI